MWGTRSVMICSLTKAAAVEARRRDSLLDPQMIGTLHSFCYRALGSPAIAETEKLKEWNEWVLPRRSDYVIESQQPDTDEALEEPQEWSSGGYLDQYKLLRARMKPRADWPKGILDFADKWEEWKSENEYLDFEDLIERCREEVEHAPGNPHVIYLDEAQDSSASELTLAQKWSRYANLVLVGDMDQAIYEWRGASPEMFRGFGVNTDRTRILEQSYRVPREVHAEALMWIRKIGAERIDAVYRPTDNDGEVRRVGFSIGDAEELLEDAEQYLSAGKSVMILGACKRFLGSVIRRMREQGVPFHNPYRIKNGAWNPLARRKGTSMADRIEAFLEPQEKDAWSAESLYKWLDLLDSKKMLNNGAKSRLKKLAVDAPGRIVPDNDLDEMFQPGIAVEAIEAAWDGKVSWLKNGVLASKTKTLDYPLRVFDRCGMLGLKNIPQIIVGTIHSVKGGEADVVYLAPDLSTPGYEQYQNTAEPNERNQVIRLFYVAMTRARESLVIMQPRYRTSPAVDLW